MYSEIEESKKSQVPWATVNSAENKGHRDPNLISDMVRNKRENDSVQLNIPKTKNFPRKMLAGVAFYLGDDLQRGIVQRVAFCLDNNLCRGFLQRVAFCLDGCGQVVFCARGLFFTFGPRHKRN